MSYIIMCTLYYLRYQIQTRENCQSHRSSGQFHNICLRLRYRHDGRLRLLPRLINSYPIGWSTINVVGGVDDVGKVRFLHEVRQGLADAGERRGTVACDCRVQNLNIQDKFLYQRDISIFFIYFFLLLPFLCVNSHLTCLISNQGTWGECNGDKKHCGFHWELNYELNSGIKQR